MYSKRRKSAMHTIKRLHDPANERQPQRWHRGWVKFSPTPPRRMRQMSYLRQALKCMEGIRLNKGYISPFSRGLVIQRQGGMEFNKDLRELVDMGLLALKRYRYADGWGGNYALNVTILEITSHGEATVTEGKISA